MAKLHIFFWVTLFFVQTAMAAVTPSSAIVVDKKTNNLHVCRYVSGRYQILKTYHATLGQVKVTPLKVMDAPGVTLAAASACAE